MNLNKIEKKPQKNKFDETLKKLRGLIDLLSDADFRNKFPEFENRYRLTIEQAERIKALSLTEVDTELTFREYLESLLEQTQKMKKDASPGDRDKIDFIIKTIKQSLNALDN